ncbi:class III lanthionine synthetase LanKC [Amycolatopsis oliviviridis]|uniref:Serine/threonine protein kinase n=1 Tax=Amycolatopsis oliviviridis TaxID=1471590 RepID=A0ABQ3MB49_9PSEU|nr:class III lanthionine synthetase LanKC [Amycolatopsis oliviviridis]GHH38229.1 serine/threonine protein kinase [Amycolatopsis oliviviridis]
MDPRYLEFCPEGTLYYDKPRDRPGDEEFASMAPVPPGWSAGERGPWRVLRPMGAEGPGQGWKIHVSARSADAERALRETYSHCVATGLPFKHLRSADVLLWCNRKYASRGSSGKFITIYPPDESTFESALKLLSVALKGVEGPYVLTDLRYGDGPLYTRYGSFAPQKLDGRLTTDLVRPDGSVVPDSRAPRFDVPDWVTVPAILRPHLAARRRGESGLPYRVTEALHFSNGGGVYRAVRPSDGERIVLKEARPYAGLDARGRDAVERLARERDILGRLAGIEGIPAVHDHFVRGGHHFLALDDMPGIRLDRWLVAHYPLTRPDPAGEQIRTYAERAARIHEQVVRTVGRVHERGIAVGDLHPGNILVDEADNVSLIDFEAASGAHDPDGQALAAPGFRAPAGLRGTAVDEHALDRLRLWLFVPLTPMLEVAPRQTAGWARFVQRRFGTVIAGAETEAASAWPERPGHADWPALRASLVSGIVDSATPERADRLFPGDIRQFSTGGTGLAYGAAGVLWALDVASGGRFPRFEKWLLDAVRREAPHRAGLFEGGHGTACVLWHLGYPDEAAALLATLPPSPEGDQGPGLSDGLAGVGLAELCAGARHGAGSAVEIGRRLASMIGGAAKVPTAGLADGWSGATLFFVRLFEHDGDRRWLEYADRALGVDLDNCVPDKGALRASNSRTGTVLPYLAAGSAGVVLALTALAAHEPDAPSVARLAELLRGCHGEFVAHPGLLHGRAGLILALAAATRNREDTASAASLATHVSALGLHAVSGPGGIRFPGHQLLRLSADLATGGAGVLLALHAAIGDPDVAAIPFLPGLAPVPAGTH